jgi:hypothetical protein
VTCGQYKASRPARPPPTWLDAQKPNSTQKPAKWPTIRRCAPWPSPSSTAAGQRRTRAGRTAPHRLALRTTSINAAIAALVRDAGHPDLDDRVRTLRTELDIAGLTSMSPTLELAVAFHQAVLGDHDALVATISRLRELTRNGDYACYVDIACFMADLPQPTGHTAPQWRDGEQAIRTRWRALVTNRRDLLRTTRQDS